MTSQPEFEIAGRRIGDGCPCFVIAEAGVNHNGSLDRALQLVDCAADAGADAVKFQTFKASAIATEHAAQASYQQRNTGGGRTQLQMLSALELSRDDHHRLIERCRQRGVLFLSTPFDEASAEMLDQLNVAVFKIPSGEVTNLPFLKLVAGFGRPMIVSTGMCRLGEVEDAVDTIRGVGNEAFALLHCVSDYPANPADVNLRAMQTLRAAFGKPVGYSDHTLGIEVGLAAAARSVRPGKALHSGSFPSRPRPQSVTGTGRTAASGRRCSHRRISAGVGNEATRSVRT
ncbi:MAG: N-acetylneuraminate synthase family protein [Planctomycetaceae bacterium]